MSGVPVPRLAATVMLVRPAPSTFEVYMVRRSQESHFVPNAYVFPGGTVTEADASEAAASRTKGIDEASLREQFRAESPSHTGRSHSPTIRQAAALCFAAVRELFEEAGVLLAADSAGRPASAAGPTKTAASREAIRRGEIAFADWLAQEGLFADATSLALFSHWITPPMLPRRYNAHFFVALARGGDSAAADAFETHDGEWISPRRALERHEAGNFQLVYPTIKHLQRLAHFDSAEALLRFARTKTIYTVLPDDAGADFSIPPELEHAW